MTAVERALFASPTGQYTYSVWRTNTAVIRTAIDTNAAFEDGSVRRYLDLGPNDQSMVAVPVRADGNVATVWNHLPDR